MEFHMLTIGPEVAMGDPERTMQERRMADRGGLLLPSCIRASRTQRGLAAFPTRESLIIVAGRTSGEGGVPDRSRRKRWLEGSTASCARVHPGKRARPDATRAGKGIHG